MLFVDKIRVYLKIIFFPVILCITQAMDLSASPGTIYLGTDITGSGVDVKLQYSYRVNNTISLNLINKFQLLKTQDNPFSKSSSYTLSTAVGLNDLVTYDLYKTTKPINKQYSEHINAYLKSDTLSKDLNDNGSSFSTTKTQMLSDGSFHNRLNRNNETGQQNKKWLVPLMMSAMKIVYIGKATYKGYKQDKILGAIKNFVISRTVVALEVDAKSKLKPKSAILTSLISKGLYSAGNTAMFGDDLSLDFGAGKFDISNNQWKWKDFHGNIFDDISTIIGYATVAEDIGKMRPFRDITALEMQQRQRKEGGPRPGEPDLREVNLEKIMLVTKRFGDEPYHDKFADNEGNLVPGEGIHVNEYRFGGNLHLDRRESGWVWHTDEFGSWRIVKGFPWINIGSNPLTGIQHIICEACPLKKIFGILPYKIYRNNHYMHNP